MNNTLYLAHYGVKGMKWGVIKKDDSYSNISRKRKHSIKQKIQDSKQKHYNKLVEKYKQQGFNDHSAKVAAQQRMRTEKAVAILGGATLTVVALYAGKKLGREYLDKTIKAGTVIQNIGSDPNSSFKSNPFYGAYKKSDKKAYGNMYPQEKRRLMTFKEMMDSRTSYNGVYNHQLKANGDIKVASIRKSRETLMEMFKKDPAFASAVESSFRKTQYGFMDPFGRNRITINKNMTKSQSKRIYDRFNQALATPEFQSKGLNEKFYSEMRKKGYDGVLDINDTKYSGYKQFAKSPTIFFGHDKWSKISTKQIDEIGMDDLAKKYVRRNINPKILLKSYGVASVVGYARTERAKQKYVERYLKEHPNTKATHKEIIAMYKKDLRKRGHK